MLELIFCNLGLQVGQLQCTAPIYATHPVSKMGQMFLYDQCLNRAAVSEFDAFDLNDVDKAFAHVTTLKYQQVFSLTGQPFITISMASLCAHQVLKTTGYAGCPRLCTQAICLC